MRICIDPGHGGNDPGAVGPTGLQEAAIARQLSKLLQSKLLQLDHEVMLTHDEMVILPDDDTANWKMRAFRANASGSDVFVSIHCRVSEDADAYGSAVLYARGSAFSALFAQHVHRYLDAVQHDRGVSLTAVVGLPQVRKVRVPAIVVEVATITNRSDEALLQNPQWVDMWIDALANALASWHEQVSNILHSRKSPAAESDAETPAPSVSTDMETDQPNTRHAEASSDLPATTADAADPENLPDAAQQAAAQQAAAPQPPAPQNVPKAPTSFRVTPIMRVQSGQISATPQATAQLKPGRVQIPSVPVQVQPSATMPVSPVRQSMQGVRVSATVQTAKGRVPVPASLAVPPLPKNQ